MSEQIFEKQSNVQPDSCGCTLARDESDHSTPDKHWQTSAFVVRCPEHEASGHSAADVHMHNWTKNEAIRQLVAQLPMSAWSPVFKEGARPKETVDAKGNRSWNFSEDDITDRILNHPVEFLLSPQSGLIAVRHPHAMPQHHAKVGAALSSHYKANLKLADTGMAIKAFQAHDDFVAALPQEHKHEVVDRNGTTIFHAPRVATFFRVTGSNVHITYHHWHASRHRELIL